MSDDTITQSAPWPEELADLVIKVRYRPGWMVGVFDDYDRGQGSRGTTLIITTNTINSYAPHQPLRVNHLFPVPPAAYDRRSWQRWLFECFHQVELHECAEFFTVDGVKPYAPSHGPGNDPYMIREVGSDVDRRISFRGDINE